MSFFIRRAFLAHIAPWTGARDAAPDVRGRGRDRGASPDKRPGRSERGAVTVEYALVMLIAAGILYGVEKDIFQPMAKDILNNFMDFISKPYP